MFAYNGEYKLNLNEINFIYGLNGHGKTSLINSLKILFKNNEMSIDKIINKNEVNAFVELKTDDFTIKKEFHKTNDKIELTVNINGEKLKGIDAHEFIESKFPDVLIDLIFYDGESDKNILNMSSFLQKKFFSKIFGLELLENMKKDCIQAKKELLSENGDFAIKLIEDEEQVQKIQVKIDNFVEEKINLRSKIASKKQSISRLKSEIYLLSDGLEEKESLLEQKLEEVTILMKDVLPILINDLPFLLSNNYDSLLEKKEKIVDIKNHNKFKEILKQNGLNEDQIDKIINDISLEADFSLSNSKTVTKKILSKIKTLKNQIEKLKKEINSIKNGLSGNILIMDVAAKLKIYEEELLDLENKLKNVILNMDDLIDEKTMLQKRIAKVYINNKNILESNNGIKILDKVISETELEIDETKTDALMKVNEYINENTKDFRNTYKDIQSIYIDDSFRLKVIDTKHKQLQMLSAGQQQVLNFLIIKSLMQYLKFNDFMIVDTPLGRLSKTNREMIMKNAYLSFDQLVLLLTDTETDGLKDVYNTKNLKDVFKDLNEYKIILNENGSSIKDLNEKE